MEFLSVHDAHCCTKHGCKYCDPNCPVVLGAEPGIRCEDCDSDDYYREEDNKRYANNITKERIKVVKTIWRKS